MASNAVAATIARCHANRNNPAQVTLASIATAAGYPGSAASPVRALFRRNGHGARANGQGRYTTNTHAGWHTALTTTHTGLAPGASKAQVAKARSAGVRNAVLGKATKAGARTAKRAAKAKAAKPATAAPVPAQPTTATPQGS